MHKIAICGCGGSGKSTVARQLGARLGLPVTHLDAVFYDEQWEPRSQDEFAGAQRRLVEADCWVIDGNYATTLAIRLAAADVVIFLDIHPVVCLWGVLWRRWQHRGSDEVSRHLRGRLNWDFVRYILGYRKHMRPRVRALLAEHAAGEVVILTSRLAVQRYLGHLAPT